MLPVALCSVCYHVLGVFAALLLVGCIVLVQANALTANLDLEGELEAKPIGIVRNPGGDVIMDNKVKLIASACPHGTRTSLRRFQAYADDNKPFQLTWSVNKDVLAQSTFGFMSAPWMNTFFSAGSTTRIVFALRCADAKKKCVVKVEGEFDCSNGQRAGFGGVVQVSYDSAAKQMTSLKNIAASNPSLLEHAAEAVPAAAARSAIRKLKSKALSP